MLWNARCYQHALQLSAKSFTLHRVKATQRSPLICPLHTDPLKPLSPMRRRSVPSVCAQHISWSELSAMMEDDHMRLLWLRMEPPRIRPFFCSVPVMQSVLFGWCNRWNSNRFYRGWTSSQLAVTVFKSGSREDTFTFEGLGPSPTNLSSMKTLVFVLVSCLKLIRISLII